MLRWRYPDVEFEFDDKKSIVVSGVCYNASLPVYFQTPMHFSGWSFQIVVDASHVANTFDVSSMTVRSVDSIRLTINQFSPCSDGICELLEHLAGSVPVHASVCNTNAFLEP